MTANAAGDKLPILTVIPRKKQILNLENDADNIMIYHTKGRFIFNLKSFNKFFL